MNRSLWLLLAAGLLAGPGNAQVPNVPGTSPPEFRTVHVVDPNAGTVTFLQHKLVPQTVAKEVEEKVNMNGMVVTVKKIVYETVTVQVAVTEVWSSKKDRAYDGEGVALPVEKVMELKKGDPVIITRNQKLEQSFERLLNKKAVVLLIVDQK